MNQDGGNACAATEQASGIGGDPVAWLAIGFVALCLAAVVAVVVGHLLQGGALGGVAGAAAAPLVAGLDAWLLRRDLPNLIGDKAARAVLRPVEPNVFGGYSWVGPGDRWSFQTGALDVAHGISPTEEVAADGAYQEGRRWARAADEALERAELQWPAESERRALEYRIARDVAPQVVGEREEVPAFVDGAMSCRDGHACPAVVHGSAWGHASLAGYRWAQRALHEARAAEPVLTGAADHAAPARQPFEVCGWWFAWSREGGHSGPGWYGHPSEYPDEGSVWFAAKSEAEAWARANEGPVTDPTPPSAAQRVILTAEDVWAAAVAVEPSLAGATEQPGDRHHFEQLAAELSRRVCEAASEVTGQEVYSAYAQGLTHPTDWEDLAPIDAALWDATAAILSARTVGRRSALTALDLVECDPTIDHGAWDNMSLSYRGRRQEFADALNRRAARPNQRAFISPEDVRRTVDELQCTLVGDYEDRAALCQAVARDLNLRATGGKYAGPRTPLEAARSLVTEYRRSNDKEREPLAEALSPIVGDLVLRKYPASAKLLTVDTETVVGQNGDEVFVTGPQEDGRVHVGSRGWSGVGLAVPLAPADAKRVADLIAARAAVALSGPASAHRKLVKNWTDARDERDAWRDRARRWKAAAKDFWGRAESLWGTYAEGRAALSAAGVEALDLTSGLARVLRERKEAHDALFALGSSAEKVAAIVHAANLWRAGADRGELARAVDDYRGEVERGGELPRVAVSPLGRTFGTNGSLVQTVGEKAGAGVQAAPLTGRELHAAVHAKWGWADWDELGEDSREEVNREADNLNARRGARAIAPLTGRAMFEAVNQAARGDRSTWQWSYLDDTMRAAWDEGANALNARLGARAIAPLTGRDLPSDFDTRQAAVAFVDAMGGPVGELIGRQ